jgi:hypothetical protein
MDATQDDPPFDLPAPRGSRLRLSTRKRDERTPGGEVPQGNPER